MATIMNKKDKPNNKNNCDNYSLSYCLRTQKSNDIQIKFVSLH